MKSGVSHHPGTELRCTFCWYTTTLGKFCCIFIANCKLNIFHLVDWEKLLYRDPSQDFSHFCAPTTTRWKATYQMTNEDKHRFITHYKKAIPDRHLEGTIFDRIHLRDPFNYLRGISWSANVWITYQTGDYALKKTGHFQQDSHLS